MRAPTGRNFRRFYWTFVSNSRGLAHCERGSKQVPRSRFPLDSTTSGQKLSAGAVVQDVVQVNARVSPRLPPASRSLKDNPHEVPCGV